MPEVAILFPPLVDTNLGEYYPSLAVLSATLREHGHDTVQIDLNEELARDLLGGPWLSAAAAGDFSGLDVAPESMPAIAARLLDKNRDRVFGDSGCHLLGVDSSGLLQLFMSVCQSFRVDESLDTLLAGDWARSPVAAFYRRFFERAPGLTRIPASVHTFAISVPMGPQLGPSLLLARLLESRYPDRAVVLGGPALSLMSDDDVASLLLAEPAIDAVGRFEGEGPIHALAAQRAAGRWEPELVPGISCRRGDTVEHRLPLAGPPLDELPFGDYDLELLSRLADPEIGIVQARGCYWGKCSYCDYVELYDGSPAYRTRTPGRFVDEVEYQVNATGRSRIAVITESIPPSFSRRISELIIERGLDVRWNSFAMVHDKFTAETFEAMAESGCEYLVIGLETMVDRVLGWVEKAATNAENAAFLHRARAAGVELKVNLIPNLPTTTRDEALAALDQLRGLADCFDRISIFPFEATRSSAIGRDPEGFGLQVNAIGGAGQAQFAQNHLDVSDPAMPAEHLEAVLEEYRAFAGEVNGAGYLGSDGSLRVDEPPADAVCQLATRFLDIQETGDGRSCYHSGTRRTFEIPPHWQPVLAQIESGRSFRPGALRIDSESERAAFREIVANRMIERLDTGPTPGARATAPSQ